MKERSAGGHAHAHTQLKAHAAQSTHSSNFFNEQIKHVRSSHRNAHQRTGGAAAAGSRGHLCLPPPPPPPAHAPHRTQAGKDPSARFLCGARHHRSIQKPPADRRHSSTCWFGAPPAATSPPLHRPSQALPVRLAAQAGIAARIRGAGGRGTAQPSSSEHTAAPRRILLQPLHTRKVIGAAPDSRRVACAAHTDTRADTQQRAGGGEGGWGGEREGERQGGNKHATRHAQTHAPTLSNIRTHARTRARTHFPHSPARRARRRKRGDRGGEAGRGGRHSASEQTGRRDRAGGERVYLACLCDAPAASEVFTSVSTSRGRHRWR